MAKFRAGRGWDGDLIAWRFMGLGKYRLSGLITLLITLLNNLIGVSPIFSKVRTAVINNTGLGV